MLIRFCATKMDLQRTRNYPIGLHPVNRQDQVGWRLMLHRRRTSQESVVQFIGGLEVGRQGLSNPGYPIGDTWVGDSNNLRRIPPPKSEGGRGARVPTASLLSGAFVHDRSLHPVTKAIRSPSFRNFVLKQAFSGYRWRNTELFVERDLGPPAEAPASFHTVRWFMLKMRWVPTNSSRAGSGALARQRAGSLGAQRAVS